MDEAHKLGRPVFGHSLDIFTAAANGYQSVEHSWSVVYTSIQDPKKKDDLDIGRMLGKIDTAEVHAEMEPAMFDKIIKAMIDKNRPLEHHLGDLVPAAIELRPGDEAARVNAVAQSAIEISAAVYSQRHRELLRQVRKDGAGQTPASCGRL